MKNKLIASTIVYLLGCLVKESVIILPIILVSYSILVYPKSRWKDLILNHLKHIILFFLAIGVIFTIRLARVSPFELSVTHPYAIDLSGKHLFENILCYQSWMFQSFFPFPYIVQHSFQFFIFGMTLVLLYGILIAFHFKTEESGHEHILFLFVWLLVGLLPVLFFPNHRYRYYIVHILFQHLPDLFCSYSDILFYPLVLKVKLSQSSLYPFVLLPLLDQSFWVIKYIVRG